MTKLAALISVSSPDLVGREAEMTLLHAALEDAERGRPSVTVISGDAGVGKSRLVQEAEAVARAEGMLALHGESLELSVGELPYAPIAAALRDGDQVSIGAAISALPRDGRRELARVFPDVVADTPTEGVHDERFGQARLFGWLLLLLRELATQATVLLTIEDLHRSDTSSRDFVRFLVQSLRSERLLVVGTVRSDELHRDHPARALIAEIMRSDNVRRIDLVPLSEEAVADQLAGILGSAPAPEFVSRIFTRGEGNPFYTEELLAAEAVGADELPPTLREALLLRADRLDTRSRTLLKLIAAAGRPVDDRFLEGAADFPRGHLEAALRDCVNHNLLIWDRRTENYAVRHALMGEAIYGDLLPAERASLHARIARALDEAEGEYGAADRAHHWELAHEPAAALRASIDAGIAAERVFGYGESLRHFERAIALWAGHPPDPGGTSTDLVDLLARGAQAARWTGDSERAQELCRRALDSFDHHTDPLRAAGLYERLGRYQPWDTEGTLEAVSAALELLPPQATAERMRLYVDEAIALSILGRWPEAREKAMQAIEISQGPDTLATESAARAVLGVAIAFLGDPHAGEKHLREALALARRADSIEDLAQVHLDLGEVLRLQGRIEDALDLMDAGEKLAAAGGAGGSYGNFMAINAADDLFRLGRWDELDERLRLLTSRRLDQPSQLFTNSLAGRLYTARGQFEPAVARLSAAAELCARFDLPEYIPGIYSGRAELELWQGRPAEARAHIADGLARLGTADNLLHIPLLHSMGARVEADIAELAAMSGDSEQARRAREAARDHHDRLAAVLDGHGGQITSPEAAAHLGSCAAELARSSRTPNPKSWEKATELWRAQRNPYQVAYCAYRHAEALAGSRTRRAQAQPRLSEAHALSATLKAEPLSAQILTLARRTRLNLDVPATAKRTGQDTPPAPPFDLTSRELEVLGLLRRGLTNREIAEALIISQHTAGVHVSHILAKLGVPNRVMAAATAERLALLPRS